MIRYKSRKWLQLLLLASLMLTLTIMPVSARAQDDTEEAQPPLQYEAPPEPEKPTEEEEQYLNETAEVNVQSVEDIIEALAVFFDPFFALLGMENLVRRALGPIP